MKKYEILYRDASNYKDYFSAELPDDTLQEGDEITVEELGFRDAEDFISTQFNRSFDENDDHNILEIVGESDDEFPNLIVDALNYNRN